jgi:putative DNA primase/helicase
MSISSMTTLQPGEILLQQTQTSDRRLNDRHYIELTSKRGLAPDWVSANCYSADIKQATEALGYTAKAAGILLQGMGWQMQFKPDKPWKADGDKKAPKYRSPLGDYDAMLPSHPTDINYWIDLEALKRQCLQIDGRPYIVITEGFFKAIAGCSHGIPTIGLLGVEMGLTSSKADPQGKRYLVKILEKFAKAGFGFIIALDADCATNPLVIEAERKLTFQLKKFKVPVRSITGMWTVDEGKGMDDFIQNQGIEAFRQMLIAAEPREWNEDAESKTEVKPKLPSSDKLASVLAELYQHKLAWESEYQLWRRYGAKHEGVWSEETKESVRGLVMAHLRCIKGQPDFNAGYVSSVVNLLQSELEVKDWHEQHGLLPLEDGVLDPVTLKLKPHSPDYRFTWRLPFKWADRSVGCQPIEEFLLKITGSEQIASVLLCYLAAIVTRRSDLQRYLELIGGGGTGKSTFMALAKALVGEENAVTSRLSLLEKNQFETAKFYRKLLVLFPDSERWQGEVSVLKQLTGQDPIRYERKGVQQCKDYVYEGMVILSANEPPESSDRTSGQERRKLTIGLDNLIPKYEGRNLAEEFRPYLPGLLKRVLEIPRERVTALIKYTDKNVPALARKKWAQLIETNPIAAWVDDCLVIHPDAKSYIGKDDPDKAGRWLYANFCKYQRESGHRSVPPVKRFSSNLRDLLKNQMKVPIQEGRDRNGAYIQGVGLRCFYDPVGDKERPITLGDCDGFKENCDALVTAETIGSVGCDGCDGFLPVESSQEEIEVATSEEISSSYGKKSEENPSPSSHPAPISLPAVTNPSPNPSQPATPDNELKGWVEYHQRKPYPNPKSDNVRSSQKRALAIRQAYRAAKTKEDLSALQREKSGEFSEDELNWVYNWLKKFFLAEFNYVQMTAKISQPRLL